MWCSEDSIRRGGLLSGSLIPHCDLWHFLSLSPGFHLQRTLPQGLLLWGSRWNWKCERSFFCTHVDCHVSVGTKSADQIGGFFSDIPSFIHGGQQVSGPRLQIFLENIWGDRLSLLPQTCLWAGGGERFRGGGGELFSLLPFTNHPGGKVVQVRSKETWTKEKQL